MAMHVMLTVDLNKVSSEARNQFNGYLQGKHWNKLSLTTTWTAKFKDGVSASDALQTTKNDVAKAADYARISDYEAAAQAGEQKTVQWS